MRIIFSFLGRYVYVGTFYSLSLGKCSIYMGLLVGLFFWVRVRSGEVAYVYDIKVIYD